MKIKTNSLEPGEPKEVEGNTVFEIYSTFASSEQINQLKADYADGIGWGDAKQRLYELVDDTLAEPRERYNELMANPAEIETKLQAGAEKARALSAPYMATLKKAVGLSS